MATTPKPAILPRDWEDPTGADDLERRAMRDFARRLRRVAQAYIDGLAMIPATPVVNARYTFRLDNQLLDYVLAQAGAAVDEILLEGGSTDLWFFAQYVEVAAARGAAQEFANLARQSPVYKAGRQSLENVLRSDAYVNRMVLTRAREFEEMTAYSSQVKADMSRLLTDGIGRGLNPRAISANLTEQLGIEQFRADRIARTEITMALKRAKWDEADDAEELYGIQTREMHLSALSATTRASHAARHAHIYTREEVRTWWASGANAINCKCSTTSTLVDNAGKPLVPIAQENAIKAKERMEARGYAWATEDE